MLKKERVLRDGGDSGVGVGAKILSVWDHTIPGIHSLFNHPQHALLYPFKQSLTYHPSIYQNNICLLSVGVAFLVTDDNMQFLKSRSIPGLRSPRTVPVEGLMKESQPVGS